MFGGVRDAYVAQINPAGSTLTYAGYLGGDADDRGEGIAIGSDGGVFIAGQTTSTAATFPVTVGPDLTYNGGRDAFIAKIEITGPSITVEGIVNAATFVGGPIAPGEIISIFGVEIGPDPGVNSTFNDEGNVPTLLAGVQVLINGVPAPLYFVGENQVNCQVPYEVDGTEQVTVQVIFNGTASNIVTIDVAETAPGLFTLENGIGQVIAVLFPEGTLNTAENPVAPGQIVTLYGTGEGQTVPTGLTGVPVDVPLPIPIADVVVRIGGVEQDILYVGGAPGFAGLLQLNIEIVVGTPAGEAVPIVVTIGGVGSTGALAPGKGPLFDIDVVDDILGVTIAIVEDPNNQGPVANGQMVMTDEDVALAITLTGSDPEGDPLTFTITRAPANGAVSAPVSTRPGSADVTYTPVANFNGLDSFDFQVADPNGGSSMATVEIEVKPLPDAPVDNNDSANAVQDTALEIDVLRNDFDPDGDALTISAVGAAGNGSTTTNGSTVAYTPGSGFIGFDSFEYTISDENGKALDTATVSVQVTRAPVPENSDPTANPQSVMTNENVPLPILLSGSDPDGDTLTFTLLTAPANGTLGPINPQSRETAEVPYTPNTDYDGPDEFMFQVDDGEGGSDMAVVNITVKRISDLTITKTGPAMATLGGMVTFDVMVFNAGPSDATGITVVDQLPPELTFSAGGSSASCSAAGQTVTCMPIDLAVGVGVTLNVEATVSGGVPTQMVTNTATVDFPDDPTAPDMAGHTVELVSLPPMVGNPGAGLETVGNTRLDVSNPPAPLTAEEEALAAEIPEAAAAPKSHSGVPSVDVASNIQTLGNVTDPENDPLIFSVSAANASTGTFSITTALGGEFTYDPPAGCGLGPDTLTYTVSDGFNMVDGTLTINFVDCIWYVKNNHSSGGDGTSVNPFNKLSDGAGDANLDDGEDASSDGEDIFVLFGDGTTTNQDSGITLNNQQRLIGEGVELTARNPFTMPVGNEPGQSLFPAGNKPQIGSPGTSDVVIETAGEERTGMEVQGLVMTGGGSIGIEVLANSLTNAEVLIANNDFGNATEGPTDRGIAAINSDEGNLTLAINNNTFVNVGDAVDDFGVSVANSFTGRTFITSFSGNVLDGISSGIGVSGTGVSMTGVIFDANPSDPDFTGDTVPAGATSVGASGSPVGATGVILTNVEGDVDFGLASGVLDVFATDAGLQANGFGPLSAGGGMGFRISVPDGSTIAGNGAALAPLTEAPTTQPKLVTALGGAMDLDPLTAVFGTSGGAGVTLLGESVSFVQIQGDLFFNSTSVLSGGLSDVFLLTNSDASIDYDGTIVDDTGFGITISGNGTAANNDTVNFNGTVDLGMDAALTNAAVEMTANDPTFTVNFNAALNIDASGADGIVGTGSGTLATVAGSSINATDGAAINIDGDSNPNEIDFGPGSLNFDTITVNDTNPAAGFGINIVDFTGTANLGVVTLNTTDGVALRLSNGGTAKTLPGSTINATDGRAIEALNVDFGTGSLHFDSVSANSIALITPVTFLNASGRINIMGGSIAETSGNPTPAIKVEDTPSSLEFILHNTTLTGSVDDELRVVSDTGPLCVSMSGNTLDAGSGAIDFDQAPTGTISVVQGDAAILAAVNGIPPANVLESGTIGYGAGCLTGGGPFDNAPTAQNDAAMVDEDMTVSINVIDGSAGGLDSDPDAGDIISLRGIMTAPTMGTATITSPTNVLYDYTGAFLGLGNSFMDTFVYELTDKAGNIVMAQVTVTVNGVAVPPNTATNDSYQTAGNTLLEVASTTSFASTAKVLVNDNLCSNDTDGGGGLSITQVQGIADGDGMDPDLAAGSIEVLTANSGTVAVTTSNCEFNYKPPTDSGAAANSATFETDSFTYDLFNGMGPATVSISFVNQIWYVDNTNPGSDIGTSTDPFNTLAEASTAAGTNDTIFVYTGDGTDTGQSSGITLLNAQRLIGQGIALTIPDSVTQQGVVVPGPQTLLVAGTQPKISGASPGVTVFNVSAVISGLDITAGTGGGIGDDGVFVDCNAAAIRTVEISNNTIAGVRHGIEISNAGCTYELDISNNHITAAGAPRAGILVAGAGQPTFITNFDSNTVDGSVAGVLGTGIHITSVTFDANRTLPNFQQVTGGTTVIGESTDRVGVNGLVLGIAGGNEVSGNLVFTDLDILATGTGLAVVGSGALTAGTGFGLTVPDGSTIDSSTGVAIDLDPLTGVFGTSGGSQVTISGQSASFTDVAGMLFFSSSSALASTTAATAFSVSGGSGDLSYAGTIANTGGNSVVVTGRTSDTVSFTGAIDDDAAGISLTTNTGAAITFTGGLDLDTTTNTAFTATGGGTVTATSGTNTIDTTAGTGLNISGTTVNATFANVTQTAGTATCVNIANSPGTKNITSLKCTTTGVGVSLNAAGTFNVDSGGAPGGSFVSATGNTAFSSMATVLGVNLATMSGASASFINNTGSAILGVGGLTGIAGATFNVNQGSAMIDYDGSITNISGDSVSITNTTANGVDLSGTINDTGTGITVSGNSGGSNTFGGTTKTVNTGANTAVDLTNNTGATITFSGGGLNVDTTTVTAFNATGGGTINIGGSTNTIDSTSGTGMNLSGVTVALSGNGVNVTTTGGTGVNVGTGTTSITGSGTDGLDIVTSGTGTGFNATSGGTVSLTGTGNSVNTSSGTGTAVKIADTTIGAGDVIFQSVSANLAANGIFLDDTGSTGGFTVTGNAGDCDSSTPTCTGGDIRNTAGANGNTAGQGVHMNNVGGGVSLTRMRIGDHANFAIFGSNVTGFTLNTCLVDGANGNSAGDDEGSIEFNGLFGSASITASEILGGLENNITVENSSGVLNRLTIDGGTIIRNNSAAFGNDGLRFAAVDPSAGGTIMNLTVENSFFTANRGEHLDTDANGSAAMDIIFSGNTLSGGHANALSQSVLVSNSDSSDVTVTFGGTTNNSTGSLLTAFTFFQSSSTTSSSSLIGTFSGNTIGATGVVGSGSAQAHGLEINATGGGTVTMAVTGNIIRRFMTNGIQVLAGAGSRFTGPAGGEQS